MRAGIQHLSYVVNLQKAGTATFAEATAQIRYHIVASDTSAMDQLVQRIIEISPTTVVVRLMNRPYPIRKTQHTHHTRIIAYSEHSRGSAESGQITCRTTRITIRDNRLHM